MSYAPAFGGRPWRMKTDKQAMSTLMGWMRLLTKHRCCKAVVVALRKYDPPKYGTLKFNDQRLLHLVPHEDAIAAVRVAVRKTGKRKFCTARRPRGFRSSLL